MWVLITITADSFPSPTRHQPFASLFDFAPEIGRQLVRDIGNRATTDRGIFTNQRAAQWHASSLGHRVSMGNAASLGDMRTYAWFFGEGGAQPLEAAFLALTYWAHKRLDAGDGVNQVIRSVIDGHENWTVLGLAVSLALESNRVSETVLPLVTAQRLWHADIARQVQNPGSTITVFGMNPRDRMTANQREALDYLLKRAFRGRSLRDLTPLFAFGSDEVLRAKLKEALQKCPEALPFSYEEEAASEPMRNRFLETAKIWAAWAIRRTTRSRMCRNSRERSPSTFKRPSPNPRSLSVSGKRTRKRLPTSTLCSGQTTHSVRGRSIRGLS